MTRETAEKKARELVSRMTLDEKIGQLRSIAPAIERLGVPEYNWWNEALHGVARAGQATVFPQAIGLAATFDPELIREVADAVSTEGRAKYNAYSSHGDRGGYKGLTFWAPNVNIFRDPRWGRGHETYGEDPYLTAEMGKAYVRGMQGDGDVLKTAACAKHFAAHSGPEGVRAEFDARVTPKDLEETYFPAFEALVREAGVEAVMGAYNRLNGIPCCANEWLIRDVLRKRWGFRGHFLSDCLALMCMNLYHKVTPDAKTSAARAINAGCELNCGDAFLKLREAVDEGSVTEETVTEAAVSLFTTRYLLGMFDSSEYDAIPYSAVECKKHLRLSEKAAEESFVLLKNNGILPLDLSKYRTVGVIGPNAFRREPLLGNYHGSASEYVTVLDGLREQIGDRVRLLYADGCHLWKTPEPGDTLSEARIVMDNSDLVILCAGLDETLEGEAGDAGNAFASGDKVDLSFPEPQIRLFEAASASGKPVVLCVLAGSDLDLSFAAKRFDAVVWAWYPGAQGGRALAKTLVGKASSFGKLPVTFYRSIDDVPAFTDYSMENRTYRYMKVPAQFPFGFGLNYGDIVMTGAEVMTGDEIAVRATAENRGERAADEVIEVYIRSKTSPDAVPNPMLCAFRRIRLSPGESAAETLVIPARAFTVVDGNGRRYEPGGKYDLWVGFGQPDARTEELSGRKSIRLTVIRADEEKETT